MGGGGTGDGDVTTVRRIKKGEDRKVQTRAAQHIKARLLVCV